MSKRIEIVLKPDQAELQDTINEKIRDVQHLPDRNGSTDIILSVPATSDVAFLGALGVQYTIKNAKSGRPSQGKVIRPYTIDQKIADFIGSLPDGDRSRFVNGILAQGIAAEKLSGKYYNYFLIRSNGSVFYVGKGQGNRINAHESEARKGVQSHKCNIIRQEWANGQEIIKQKIAFFDNEEDAYELEILLINFFGRENLANGTDGGEGGDGRPDFYPERQRCTWLVSPELLSEIDKQRGMESRAIFVEQALRKALGMPPLMPLER